MATSLFHGESEDPEPHDPAHHDVGAAGVDSTDPTSWPAMRFSVDPASSPVLMAAFAWSSPPAGDVRDAG